MNLLESNMILTFKKTSLSNPAKHGLMPYTFYYLLLLAISFPGTAQVQESPYMTIGLQDLKEFKPTGGNWKTAGDVFYDLNESGKGKITPGTGILVNDLSGKAKDHLVTNMEHGDIDIELDFMMDKGSN